MPPCPTKRWHCQQPCLTNSCLPFSEADDIEDETEHQAGGNGRQPNLDYEQHALTYSPLARL